MTKPSWPYKALIAHVISGQSRNLLVNLSLLIGVSHPNISVRAQNCPEPWTNAAVVYGTVTLQGTGNGTQGLSAQTINQSATAQVKLISPSGAPECMWSNGATGSPAAASVNDAVTNVCGDSNPTSTYTDTWFGDSAGNCFVLLFFNGSSTYQISFGATVNGTNKLHYNTAPCGIANSVMSPISLGTAPSGGIQSNNLSLAGPAPVLTGTFSVAELPYDVSSEGLNIPANWTLTWNFSPVPDDTVDEPCVSTASSDIGCQNQSLGEDIPIIGTPFSLHYQSDRQFGRGGADPVAIRDAQGLGGWTLSVHHVLEPQVLTLFCIDGSCSPASRQLKALYLGDGRMRCAAKVQAPVRLSGKVYLTSEDGGEIYVFDGSAGRHLQTLRPLTGAILYNFGYDNGGELISVTDAYGNVTKILRDTKEHPIAVVSPYGQATSLALDSNGYLNRITDPAGKSVLLVQSTTGLLTSITDANGSTSHYWYDPLGRTTLPAG